jgi:hypothetical protein
MPWRLVLKLVEIVAIRHLCHRLYVTGPATLTSRNSKQLVCVAGRLPVKEFTIGVIERERHQAEGD